MELNVEWKVILNPHAGCGKGRRDKEKIVSILDNSGLSYTLHVSEQAGHSFELAKDLAINGATHFIVAGGDGTLNETVNGIFNGKNSLCDHIVIGMLPVGTGNDWIRTFGIPDHYQMAMDIILKGKTVVQDVGLVEYMQEDRNVSRYFVNIAGFGFDAMVATRANKLKNNGLSGLRVYIESFLWSYFNHKASQTIIAIDDSILRVNLFSAGVGIGKFNGGGMMQVPDANPVNGNFHITIIRNMSIWGIIGNFLKLYNGSFVHDYRVSTHIGKRVQISAAIPLSGEVDGESIGNSNFNLLIIPHQLRVIYGDDKFKILE
ncbi:MAG TPA: diacylglycerol kinase family protein [Prolixibacteraceae bacterium]